jgi:imidazolonepropionase-like amidohydrolase
MVRYGMTPMEALQAATVNAAELIGWTDRVGCLSPGTFADLIAVNGNPMENIRLLEDVEFVMKGGKVYVDQRGTK